MKHEHKGIGRLVAAFWNSVDGIRAAWKSEEAVRTDVCLLPFVIAFIILHDLSTMERIALWFSTFFVFFAEIANTAIEYCVDRVGTQWHAMSKVAKDLGSLMVLSSLVNFIVVWVMVLV